MAATRKRTTAAAEPATVLVEWIRDAPLAPIHPRLGHDQSAPGAADIGGRRYGGRVGERATIRADDAEILAGGGFVKYLPEPEPEAEAEQVV
jgi:hypothetical protein